MIFRPSSARAGDDAVPQVHHGTEPPDLILPERQRLRLEHLSGPDLPAHLMPRDRERQQAAAPGELRHALGRTFRQQPVDAQLLVAWP